MTSAADPTEQAPRGRGANQVFKSGALYISSKGLGWKSWKRRWFILNRNSLVFYKSDPNVASQNNELNLALGGIDLNNSGSVHVRAEKKLLTILFPDGRAFTLKAETLEDLEEWKTALERALAAAPSPASVQSQNGIFRNDSIDAGDGLLGRERCSAKSQVVGRPILLALEEVDGSPSFLEKALCYIEQYGVKIEGILRQSADVDDVEQRVRDFDRGKNKFGADDDPHIVADCIKYVLRELPSSPVPTPCCTALLEAYRMDRRELRAASMRVAVAESFPEPNRRLLQRLLKMMRVVAAHKSENRMTSSAVAACMAPLVLRPLLAGECTLEDDSDISGDSSAQLLAAATAANNAQAIITFLMEEYNSIFETELLQAPASPDTHLPATEGIVTDMPLGKEVLMDDSSVYPELEDSDRVHSCALSESSGYEGSDIFDDNSFDDKLSNGRDSELSELTEKFTRGWSKSVNLGKKASASLLANGSFLVTSLNMGSMHDASSRTALLQSGRGAPASKVDLKSQSSTSSSSLFWVRSPANRKNAPTVTEVAESSEEEAAIQKLEVLRNELRSKISKEAKGNAALLASLEKRKQALYDRRFALEHDVVRLQEQLQAERNLRAALETDLSASQSQRLMTQSLELKAPGELDKIAQAEAEVAKLKQKVAELHQQLNQQRQQGAAVSQLGEWSQMVKNLEAQKKIIQQECALTLAICQHEKVKNPKEDVYKGGHGFSSPLSQSSYHQRSVSIEAKDALKGEKAMEVDLHRRSVHQEVPGIDWRVLRPPPGPSAGGRQFAWRRQPDSFNNPDSWQNDASSNFIGDCSSVADMGSQNSARRSYIDEGSSAMYAPPRQSVTSSALAELTTRLNVFKERRTQIMEQIQSLDSPIPSPSSMDNRHDPS